MRAIGTHQRRERLAQRHRLAPAYRLDDPSVIAESLVALHSSDPATVHLSVVARMTEPAVAATSAALYDTRSLVRHHGMRRTIWVLTPEIARVVHAACTADIASKEWAQLTKWVTASGFDDPASWVRQARSDTLAALHRFGPCSARELGRMAPALTTEIEIGSGRWAAPQPAHTRLLSNLGFDGAITRTAPTGSWVSSEYRWSVMSDWLPDGIVGLDPATARTDLVRRYLHAFGPATTADVQWWLGWTMGATKAALAANSAVEVALEDGVKGWVLPDDVHGDGEASDEAWVALLPSLDPTAMGWKQREWYLGEWSAFGGPLFDRNGNVGPTVWANGKVVGGWAQRKDGSIVHELLGPVDRSTQRAVVEAAERLRAVIGDARITPRFPTPLQKSLAVG
ncbi:MAG: winged helix DNA-binding domain-containing protein [Ilumatobacteraceae bacterium]